MGIAYGSGSQHLGFRPSRGRSSGNRSAMAVATSCLLRVPAKVLNTVFRVIVHAASRRDRVILRTSRARHSASGVLGALMTTTSGHQRSSRDSSFLSTGTLTAFTPRRKFWIPQSNSSFGPSKSAKPKRTLRKSRASTEFSGSGFMVSGARCRALAGNDHSAIRSAAHQEERFDEAPYVVRESIEALLRGLQVFARAIHQLHGRATGPRRRESVRGPTPRATAGGVCPAHSGIAVLRPSCPAKTRRLFVSGLCVCGMCGCNC